MLKIIVVDMDFEKEAEQGQYVINDKALRLVAAFPEGRTLADLHAWLAVKPRAPRADKGKPRKGE